MFERYSEKARRAIFFARYECSELGSSSIKPEHILLGLLRESREVVSHLNVSPSAVGERLRTEPSGKKIATSVDLPLDNAAKRVLAYAEEEADGMKQRLIGTEHLLLGIMRVEECRAAQVLREMGAPTVGEVRNAIRVSAMHGESQPPGGWAASGSRVGYAGGVPVKLIDEDGLELSVSSRFPVPRIGERVSITREGEEQSYRVTDVRWIYTDGVETYEVRLSMLEVRLQREPGAQ